MIIKMEDVTKVYSSKKRRIIANDCVNLQVDRGEIFGLFGHNGAGKTTIVNQLLGTLKPTSGNIEIAGENIIKTPHRGRYLCSLQPQSQIPLGELTPRKVVKIMGKMRGCSDKEADKQIDKLFEQLDIMPWADVEGNKLSGGILRLTGFCMAAIQPGKVIILDEPTNDVDPVRRRYLWDVIRDLTNTGAAVVLVTHNIRESESAVDNVAILNRGKVLIQGSKNEVKHTIGNILKLEAYVKAKDHTIVKPEWCESLRYDEDKLILSINKSNAQYVIEWVNDYCNKGILEDYTLSQTSLEDVYVDLIKEEEK